MHFILGNFNPAHFGFTYVLCRIFGEKTDLDLGLPRATRHRCVLIECAANSKIILPLELTLLTCSATIDFAY